MAIHHASSPSASASGALDVRRSPRVLAAPSVLLRLLELRDAPSLLLHLNTPGSARFAGAPPSTLEGMRGFIRWTQRARRQGRCLVYGVIPEGQTAPVGVAQLRRIEMDFSVAELGFVIGEAFWGRGLFAKAAGRLLDFAFDEVEVHRIEGRVAEDHTSAHAAMRKIGATREALLRESRREADGFQNHVLWSLLAREWRARRSAGVEVM